ncbi:uncharacterized protein LOC134716637 [Mytilus trossulus]|uniref:uncharacterized protein LOC134716637 n=1 Tax=Mytilus trossulus TaxID=6551 RepID=UPI00300662B6
MENFETEITENHLIGIQLINGGRTETQTCLGVVMVAKNEDLSLHSLRDLMCSQVTALPETFIFCTKQGWNINWNLENSVFVKQIVSEECSLFIQRYFEMPCIGIRQRSGENLGMVFVDLHCVLYMIVY